MKKNRLRNTRIIFRTHIIRHKEGNSNYGGNHENEGTCIAYRSIIDFDVNRIGWRKKEQ